MRDWSRLVLALGYAGGAVLVVLLLTKGSADALTGRVGFSALAVIVLGLIGAAGMRLVERPDRASLWGWATLLVAVVAFVMTVVEIWSEGRHHASRLAAMVVIAFLLGGGSLALSGEHGGEGEAVRLTRGACVLSLVALGVLTVLALSHVHIATRWFGVCSAVFLVSALSLPILRLGIAEDGS